METYNNRLDSPALRQPLPQISDRQAAKNFAAVKNSADRSKEDNVPNGGPQYRGPLEGGATGGSPSPSADRMTGLDGGGVFFRGRWDVGSKGLQVDRLEGGATAHTDWMPGKGIGPGVKDGKPGVAEGDAKGGSVNTPGDVKGGAASSAGGGKSGGNAGVPEGLDWSRGTRIKGDDIKDMKRDIPQAPPKNYNDLGPSTNEPEQKQKDEDTTVA
jgi:hypothetical protein